MINSMTGFGRGTAQVDTTTATVEMRSVNSRYCEVSVRMPRSLATHEADIQTMVKQAFARGRINVQVQIEQTSEEVLPIQVDAEAAKAYMRLLNDLREAAGLEEPVRLEHLLNYSDVFTTPDDDTETAAEAWEAVQAALAEAIEGMQQMRQQEGRSLQDDLEQRAQAIAGYLEEVEARSPERVNEARRRLHKRVEDLLGDDRVDADRLEVEIALLADKLDVTEECVRLQSHLQLFNEALQSEAAEGRKLNFIVQEIHREINTIGSKANDAHIARLAVQMKDELEKIREQVQNIE